MGNLNNPSFAEYKISTDLLQRSTATQSVWNLVAISTGAFGAGPELTHPGVGIHKSSTSANSGFGLMCDVFGIILGGGEKTTIIFKTEATLTDITRRMGFHTTLNITAPTDGAYCKIADGVLTGQTAKGSAASTTGSNYSLSPGTWYRLVIELNTNATLVTFTLFADNSSTVLWQDTLNTNIPTGTIGHGDVCTMGSPGAVTALGRLDYIDVVFPQARRIS